MHGYSCIHSWVFMYINLNLHRVQEIVRLPILCMWTHNKDTCMYIFGTTYILRGQWSGLESRPPPVTKTNTSWLDWPGYGWLPKLITSWSKIPYALYMCTYVCRQMQMRNLPSWPLSSYFKYIHALPKCACKHFTHVFTYVPYIWFNSEFALQQSLWSHPTHRKFSFTLHPIVIRAIKILS